LSLIWLIFELGFKLEDFYERFPAIDFFGLLRGDFGFLPRRGGLF